VIHEESLGESPGKSRGESPEEARDETPAPPRRSRRALTTGLVVLLALGAVGSGAGYAAIKLDEADRTAPTRVWQQPRPQKTSDGPGDKSDGKGKGSGTGRDGLAARLLPMPDGYYPGPDIKEYGNDAVLTGKQAVAVLKQGGRDLPSQQRRRHAASVDKLRVKGLGVRSYSTTYGGFVAEMNIAQLDNRKAGSDLSRFQRQFAEALGIFRKGPKIDGHRNASCFLLPKGPKKSLDMMICNAYEDNLLVTMTAYGTRPLDTKEAASLLKRQLDHVASPGEYV
jgi:hypothetical protein